MTGPPHDGSRLADAKEVAERTLGWRGRMISHSKSLYEERHPGHLVVFNAHLCLADKGVIWSGDIDVESDAAELVALAAELGETLYLVREIDGGFKTNTPRRIDRAAARIHPDGRLERLTPTHTLTRPSTETRDSDAAGGRPERGGEGWSD